MHGPQFMPTIFGPSLFRGYREGFATRPSHNILRVTTLLWPDE